MHAYARRIRGNPLTADARRGLFSTRLSLLRARERAEISAILRHPFLDVLRRPNQPRNRLVGIRGRGDTSETAKREWGEPKPRCCLSLKLQSERIYMPVPPVLARRTRSFIYLRHPSSGREGAQQPPRTGGALVFASICVRRYVEPYDRPRKHGTRSRDLASFLPRRDLLDPRYSISSRRKFFTLSASGARLSSLEQGNRPYRESQFCRNCRRDWWSRCRSYVISVREFRTRCKLCLPSAFPSRSASCDNRDA